MSEKEKSETFKIKPAANTPAKATPTGSINSVVTYAKKDYKCNYKLTMNHGQQNEPGQRPINNIVNHKGSGNENKYVSNFNYE